MIISALTVVVICVGIFPGAEARTDRARIAVLFSGSVAPYKEAYAGFSEHLSLESKGQIREFFLTKDVLAGKKAKEEIARYSPDIILSIGTEATKLVKNAFPEIPVVFIMVLNPVENGILSPQDKGDRNLAGVTLNVGIETQFEWIKRIRPSVKAIGLLCHKGYSGGIREKAVYQAEKMDIRLISEEVEHKSQILSKLESVCDRSDFLWGVPDPFVYNSYTARKIILTTLRNKVPFMAFSRQYVKAGALLAVESDYREVGVQGGMMVKRILGGEPPGKIDIEKPMKYRIFFNSNTAEKLGIVLPDQILSDEGAPVMVY